MKDNGHKKFKKIEHFKDTCKISLIKFNSEPNSPGLLRQNSLNNVNYP